MHDTNASSLMLFGAIWEYWREISTPSGRGIEAPVEEVSGEVETKDLCEATLTGPGRDFSC